MRRTAVMLLITLLLATLVTAAPLATSGGTIQAQVGSSTPSTTTATSSGGGGGTTSSRQCNDHKDNDNDGLIDLDDPGCVNSQDNYEYEEQVVEQVIADFVVTDVSGTSRVERYSLMDLLDELIEEYNSEPSLLSKVVEKIKQYYGE